MKTLVQKINERFALQHKKPLKSFKNVVKRNYGEDLVHNELKRCNINFKEQVSIKIPEKFKHLYHSNCIRPDFVAEIQNTTYFIESKYQDVSGTVSEKIAGTVRKYKYFNTPVIIVFNGEAFSEKFIEIERNHLKEDGLSHKIHLVQGKALFHLLNNLNIPAIAENEILAA